jgi:RNA polymerase sigma-70 factor (ECF subfamily)
VNARPPVAVQHFGNGIDSMTRAAGPPAEPTDADLVARVRCGDAAALDVLFRRHRAVAYRVAHRLLGNEADALDAVQDGFVNAITHLDRFRGTSSFKTWLLRVVSNAALDLGRSRRRRDDRYAAPATDPFPGLSDDRLAPPDHGLERADLRHLLVQALAALPEPQRRTFVLHADGGLSYQEVADALGIAIGTVMSRLFYARQRLKSYLAQHVTP